MKKLLILIVVVSLGALLVSEYGSDTTASKILFETQTEKFPPTGAETAPVSDIASVIGEPAPPPEGYIKYENKKYGFYYYRSPQAVITEYDEGGGAMTIVQENAEKVRGLQIFVMPYEGEVITDERFLMDVPSGVRYNINYTTIGKLGVPVVTFNSFDPFLGDTREVWFIRNGYLYEVTTFKGMGDWFGPIMQTWRFL